MRKIISIIDDDAVMLQFLGKILQSDQHEIQLFSSPKQFVDTFQDCIPDLVISDLLMPEMDGLDVLRHVKAFAPTVPFIMLTTEAKVQSAIQAMKEGVVDYIIKPIDTQEFRLRIERAYEFGKLRQILQTNIASYQKIYAIAAIVGESKTAKKARELALAAQADHQQPLWLVGEDGVGKSFLARTIHYSGATAAFSCVEVNCDTLAESELDNTLFGSTERRGARLSRVRGSFEQADGGTLILRNPESLPEYIQKKISAYIRSGKITPVGATAELSVSVQLVCVSSSEERYLAHVERFNAEFLQCFAGRSLVLLPLRKRREDIVPLARYILQQEAGTLRSVSLADDAVAKLEKYNWYGNVAELVLTMKRALLLCQDAEVGARDIITGYSAWTVSESDAMFQVPQGMHIKDVQGEYVRQTLDFFEGNLEKAARSLGVSRKTLWEVRKKFNLP